ncbi:MAG: c-type cytochrome biogenesis protein CcmI [Paracoccus sp. (in: a-proteobacteria)]|nr:c-type cytochrome biogenesis protein CcmI [Paracoccus sp. (in: a-proteobacteria)]
MLFWITLAAMTAIVAIAITAPFWRTRETEIEPVAAYDLRVYRDQLAEVDRDVARGIITEADAERARVELGRKVLDADRRLAREAAPAAPRLGRHGLAALSLLAVSLGAAGWIYLAEGRPDLNDKPLGARYAAAQAQYDARPSQAEAEARAAAMPRGPAPEADPDYLRLIEQLRSAVEANPDDPEGLRLLAFHEARLGNVVDARAAQAHLVATGGDAVSGADHAMLAVLMLDAAGGVLTQEAEREVALALRREPQNPQARYMAGLLHAQNGRPDRAFPIWAQLLAEGPAEAPWNRDIRAVIEDVAWLAGRPDYTPPAEAGAAAGAPGPDAAMIAAAEQMSPEERQAMIGGMVAQLEQRLASQGGTADEWARLISSHAMLGNTDHANAILSEARERFAASPESLAALNAAAASAGLDAAPAQ